MKWGRRGGNQRRFRAGRDSWVSNATDLIQRLGTCVVSMETSARHGFVTDDADRVGHRVNVAPQHRKPPD